MKIINGIPVFGELQENALTQIVECAKTAEYVALMGDHHQGYSMPIGGVAAYKDKISPSGVGYDIGCGNKAVKLDLKFSEISEMIPSLMDSIASAISFGVGMKNKTRVEHPLFDSPTWHIIAEWNKDLKELAQTQLGTVGSGNHYVDLFKDEEDNVWIGVHFGSRGLGHKIASHYIKEGGGVDQIDAAPTLLDVNTQLGRDYIDCMNLAGEYAYAGRDWVCAEVARIIGAEIVQEIHNHHNFAWKEEHFGQKLWVVRKGATPAFPGQLGFVGGSMGENSVILEGVDSEISPSALYSTIHGAGRVMSRTKAAGRKKWKRDENGVKRQVVVKEGCISQEMMNSWIKDANVVLRGGGTDESPHCYKRLPEVLAAQGDTIKILHTLIPVGVVMAGEGEFDPYKD